MLKDPTIVSTEIVSYKTKYRITLASVTINPAGHYLLILALCIRLIYDLCTSISGTFKYTFNWYYYIEPNISSTYCSLLWTLQLGGRLLCGLIKAFSVCHGRNPSMARQRHIRRSLDLEQFAAGHSGHLCRIQFQVAALETYVWYCFITFWLCVCVCCVQAVAQLANHWISHLNAQPQWSSPQWPSPQWSSNNQRSLIWTD